MKAVDTHSSTYDQALEAIDGLLGQDFSQDDMSVIIQD